MPNSAAKLIVSVTAGVLPGQPMNEFSQRWTFTSEQWAVMNDKTELEKPVLQRSAEWQQARSDWIRVHGESREYQASLENPARLNWVNREWIWL